MAEAVRIVLAQGCCPPLETRGTRGAQGHLDSRLSAVAEPLLERCCPSHDLEQVEVRFAHAESVPGLG
jgi:hypothetical protein